jgi:hypothetical protein
MLLRRYGTSLHSVLPHFDARALTEISFRKDGAFSLSLDELDRDYEKIGEEKLGGETEGSVQSEAEAALLERLGAGLSRLLAALSEEQVAVIENRQGVDYPKVRDHKRGTIEDGENRLYFEWRVDPPLRIGLYRRAR